MESSKGRRGPRRPTRPLKFVPPPGELPPPVHFAPPRERPRPALLHPPPPTLAVRLLTEGLLEIFAQCNATFHFDRRLNPRRVLTKPARPTHNAGHDNEKHDYILYVNDVLGNEEGRKYVIMDLLGQGTFGQVVKCQNLKTKELVAVKVIKNQPAFFNQSMMEVTVLEMLNQRYDKDDKHHIVRMRDTFVFRQHLCIVVELLSLNLYDLIKQNQYRGFSLTLCKIFLQQILDAMRILKDARIIHCDLKPENILLKNLESPAVKVIDYGSACHEHQTLYTYIQSRFYRSPEVLLGLPYSSSIDMWSLGCIAAELFLGLPVFPGASNYDQICRIVQTLGSPPTHMLEVGKETLTYFERTFGVDNRAHYHLKSREKYSLDSNRVEPPPKQYFNSTHLDDIILGYPIRPRDISPKERDVEVANRRCFLDFIKGLLNINPIERWSPMQAAQHPFITGKPFTMPFVPPISSAPIPLVPATTRVRVGASSRQRPRANTLSSLSLQDVPPQIQRLAAARDKNAAVAPATERRDTIPEVSDIPPEGGAPLPFETDVSYSPSALASSKHTSASPSGLLIKPSASSAHADRMNAYVSNRRVSQPAVPALAGRYAAARNSNSSGYANVVPSSVPNAVWYGPDLATSPEGGGKTPRRRGSLRPEPDGVPTNTWSSPRRASISGTTRRSTLGEGGGECSGGGTPPSASSMDVVEEGDEEGGHERQERL